MISSVLHLKAIAIPIFSYEGPPLTHTLEGLPIPTHSKLQPDVGVHLPFLSCPTPTPGAPNKPPPQVRSG